MSVHFSRSFVLFVRSAKCPAASDALSESPRTPYNVLYVFVASSAECPAVVNPVSRRDIAVRVSLVLSARSSKAFTPAIAAAATAAMAATAIPADPFNPANPLPVDFVLSARSSVLFAASSLSFPRFCKAAVCCFNSFSFLLSAVVSLFIFVRNSTACLLVGSSPFDIRSLYCFCKASTFLRCKSVVLFNCFIFALIPSDDFVQSSIPAAAALNSLSLSLINLLACASPAFRFVVSIVKLAPKVSEPAITSPP